MAKIQGRVILKETPFIIRNSNLSSHTRADGNLQTHRRRLIWLPEDGKALLAFLLSRQTTLKAARDSALASVGLSLQRSEERTVNGMPAIVALSKLVNEDHSTGTTGTNIFLSYFIQYGSIIYTFHGSPPKADFSTYCRCHGIFNEYLCKADGRFKNKCQATEGICQKSAAYRGLWPVFSALSGYHRIR